MTYEKKFESLKKKFVTVDTSKFDRYFAIQFVMTDEDCHGIFYISYIGGEFVVAPYDYVDNTATVTAASAEIAKLANGTVSKSLVVDGDADVVKAFAAAYKKAAAKKAPAKKACAKKASK